MELGFINKTDSIKSQGGVLKKMKKKKKVKRAKKPAGSNQTMEIDLTGDDEEEKPSSYATSSYEVDREAKPS